MLVFERLALAVIAGAAVSAFAMAHGAVAAWGFLAPVALSVFVQWGHVPRRFAAGVAWVSRTAAAGMALVALVTTLYPVVSRGTIVGFAVPLGYALSACAALFTLGGAAWPPAGRLFPAAAGLLAAAGVTPGTAGFPAAVSIAAAAAFAWLMVAGRLRLRPVPLLVAGAATLAAAVALVRFLPWAQPRVEAAMAGILGTRSIVYSGLTSYSSLGEIEELALSPAVVLRVWTTEPQNLRAHVYTRFNGRTWAVSPNGARRPLERFGGAVEGDLRAWAETIPGEMWTVPGREGEDAAGARAVRTRIVQTLFNAGALVTPPDPLLVRLPAPASLVDPYGILLPADTEYEVYGVVNRSGGGPATARGAVEGDPSESLTLPKYVDPRMRELAARLSNGVPTAEEKLRRTVAYLQSNCRYSLQVGAFATRDPVSEFVFEKKRGYCEYFASALALLLRLQGVPARYVAGFSVRSDNWEGGHYVVREADAHAWVEAHVPGRGWVEADATPPGEYAALRAGLRGGGLSAAWEWVKSRGAELGALLSGGGWREALRWLGGQFEAAFAERPYIGLWMTVTPAAAVLAFRAWRRRRAGAARAARRVPPPGSRAVPAELEEWMRRLDRAWARAGHPRPPSRAPLEHLRSLPPASVPPDSREAIRRGLDVYYRAVFGGAPPAPAEWADVLRGTG